ncbi:HNH endonuclease [Streptomyces kaempferi]|uniref:AI2M/AI1M-like HNH endonuclease domain-containing protein n=1 Tax=Streptomyces kaempferi TaxID=333725 RepID=A0ABW3XVP9_9ACTN
MSGRCELCKTQTEVEVHHIRRLSDLRPGSKAEQPDWAKQMASRRRKTLIVCRECHNGIHSGLSVRQDSMESTLESRVR